MADDKHILVNNDYLERPPVYSETQSKPVISENRYQSPKFFGCCQAHIGWTIWYSIKSLLVIKSIIVLGIYWDDIWDEASLELMVKDIDFDIDEWLEWEWAVFCLLNLGNVLFLVCFGLLMYGVHGKSQSRHGFFFPMIVNEWMQAILVCSVFIIGLFSGLFLGDMRTVGIFFIPTAIILYVYIAFPIYLNRFRVHVKETTNYSSPV